MELPSEKTWRLVIHRARPQCTGKLDEHVSQVPSSMDTMQRSAAESTEIRTLGRS